MTSQSYYDTEEFRRRWKSDEALVNIASSVGVDPSAISQAAKRRGLGPKGTTPRPSDWTDMEMLTALSLRDHFGRTGAEIALKLGKPSRASVLGLLHRIDTQTNKHDLSPHLNGSIKPDWWMEGLAKR